MHNFTITHFFSSKYRLIKWSFLFFSANVFLVWLISVNYILQISPSALVAHEVTNQILTWLFLLSAFIGHLGLLVLLPWLLVILPLTLVLSKKHIILPLSIILATSINFLFIIDSIVFSQYHFHLNGIVLSMFMSAHAHQIFDFTWFEWVLSSLLIGGLLVIEIVLAKYIWHKILPKFNQHFAIKFVSFIAICLLTSYCLLVLAQGYPNLGINRQTLALPLYPHIANKLMQDKSTIILTETLHYNYSLPATKNNKLNYPLHPLVCKPSHKPLNIVLIVIDSWRHDMLNMQVTPNITKFASKTLQFKYHFSGGNGTKPGIFSLFYGLPATYWNATILQQQGPVLIDTLLNQNYQLGIFASAALLMPEFNLNVFREVPNLQTTTPGKSPYLRDQEITKQFQYFIDKVTLQKKPFFSFLFYDSAHSYCFFGNPVKRFTSSTTVCNRLTITRNTDPIPYLNIYKNALYYDDSLVKDVLNTLKHHKLLENTMVIITSDHGDEFNDNHLGYWGHASNFTSYQIQVPLIIYWPKQNPVTFTQQSNHYDIVPTLLNKVLGCKNTPADYSIGNPLPYSKIPSYLLVDSYTNFGIVEQDKITTIFPGGDYTITDKQQRLLSSIPLNIVNLNKAFSDMQRYYQK